jgi:N,N'-diacetyllegionaminate synthase
MRKKMKVGNQKIGHDCPVYVIAEVGINHNGDMKLAKELLQSAKESGANAVKLQTYITEKRVPSDSPVFDILKKCELSFDEQEELFAFGKELNIEIFSTPFDDESVDFLDSIGCPAYKIASFDSVNHALLRKVSNTNKPVIMSTGMTNLDELGAAWKSLGGNDDGTGCELALLHCVSSYPTPEEEANLSLISLLKELHGGPVGYSDHTIGVEVPVMAVAAGAQIIEKHFTLDTQSSGPDHSLSADPKTLNDMIKKIRRMEKILGKAEMRIREIESSAISFRRVT